MYLPALGRAPTAGGAGDGEGGGRRRRSKSEGVEDLLWAVVMLPEFQLIR